MRRLGSTRSEPVDVWIVAATSEDLGRAVAGDGASARTSTTGSRSSPLRLPPLRERGEDILLLAEHFLARACADYGLPPKTLTARRAGGAARLSVARQRARAGQRHGAGGAAHRGAGGDRGGAGAPRGAGARRGPRRSRARGRGPSGTPWAPSSGSICSRPSTRPAGTSRARPPGSDPAQHAPLPDREARPPAERAGPPGRRRRRPPAAGSAPRRPPPAGAGSRAPWERRRLAFLRAVLGAAAGRATSMPDAARALEVLVEKVQSFGGRVEELSPTGVIALFGLEPIEDAPRRAAHAALAIRRAAERTRSPPPTASARGSRSTRARPRGRRRGRPR